VSFHVPETARLADALDWSSTTADGNNGAFWLTSPEPGWHLLALVSDGDGWEHVSVSARVGGRGRTRTPTWKEMAYVKALFWEDEDVVVQYHPRKSEYVNCHKDVLHLWRPTSFEMPTPPPEFVGPLATEKR
jgi:hypothetical protein